VSTRKRPKAIRRPALALAGDPGDDIRQVLDDLPTWDAFTAPLPDGGDPVWYSAPAAAAAETAPMPAAETTRPLPVQPEPEPAPVGTPVYEETIAGWGHITRIRCAGTRCIRVYADPAPSYAAMYEAARRRGWRRDAYGRDFCGRCAQLAPEYRTSQPVCVWARHAPDARLRRDLRGEYVLRVQAAIAVAERTVEHWAASHARGTHAGGAA